MDSVNPKYTDHATIKEITTAFRSAQDIQSIQLKGFLTNEACTELKEQLESSTWKKDYKPELHAYSTTEHNTPIFTSPSFITWLQEITGMQLTHSNAQCLKFNPGDYTLQHEPQQQGIHVILDLNTCQEQGGGFTSCVKNGIELIKIIPEQNALSILNQSKGVNQFVKYLNHHATSRLLIHAFYVAITPKHI